MILFGPVFPPVPLLGLSHLGIAVWLRQGLSAPIIGSIPIHLLRCTTITPAAATPDLLLPSRSTAAATATRVGRCGNAIIPSITLIVRKQANKFISIGV